MLVSGLFNTPELSESVISQLAAKIGSEMKYFSDANNFTLGDTVEAVKNFRWETVKLELNRHFPTFMSLLSFIVNKPFQRVPLMCFIAALLLKCRHQHLSKSCISDVCGSRYILMSVLTTNVCMVVLRMCRVAYKCTVHICCIHSKTRYDLSDV